MIWLFDSKNRAVTKTQTTIGARIMTNFVLIVSNEYSLFRTLGLAGTTANAGFFYVKGFQGKIPDCFFNSISALNSRISQDGHITFSPL